MWNASPKYENPYEKIHIEKIILNHLDKVTI